MRNKKLVFVLLAIMVLGLLVLAGCANTDDNMDNDNDNGVTESTPMAVPGTVAPEEGATQPVETNQTGTATAAPTVTVTP